jgi:hypothetical protein
MPSGLFCEGDSMSTNVTLNGVTYSIPAEGDDGWGTVLSNFFISIGSNVLQKTGGTFALTSEANFGATYGLKSAYLKSQATNPSATGALRLGNNESIGWRNAANGADLSLKVDSSNNLNFDGATLSVGGTPVQPAITVSDTSTIDLTLAANNISGAIVAASIANSHISGSAAIAYSKLSLTGAILNADLAGSIAYSKLALTGAILNADLAGSVSYSKLSLTGAILNADLAGSIAYSKLSLTGAILNADLAGSIAASKLVGSDIATVGTVTTGTWSATTVALNKGGTGQTTKAAAFDALSPMSASGDIVYGGTSGTGTRLAKGSDGQVLTLASGLPSWGSSLTNPMSASGDIIVGGVSGAANRLAKGSDGQHLILASGTPAWAAAAVATSSVNFNWSARTDPTSNNTVNFSEGIQTITFSGSGKYKITLNHSSTHSQTYTASRVTFNLGGSATRSDFLGSAPFFDGIDAQDSNQYGSVVIYGSFTNGQTVTILPSAFCTYSSNGHTFNAGYLLEYIN